MRKIKINTADDVVKKKKIALQFILFIIGSMKQGSSLKKAFYEEHSYLKSALGSEVWLYRVSFEDQSTGLKLSLKPSDLV